VADTGPVWDGTGQDPWLPHRLDAAVDMAEAEMAVREAVWGEMSKWLVKVSRAVLKGTRPDPFAVFSQDAAWRQAVDRIVGGPILDVITKPYVKLMGPAEYDSAPMVVEHLATVNNRMVRTTENTFDLVSSEIAQGVELGESIPELAERVEVTLSDTLTERWPNRATVVARTEALSACNAGRTGAFEMMAETLGGDFDQVWISTIDHRTRPTHRTADGQRVPLGTPFTVGTAQLRFPGDPLGPGKEVIQCRCSTILLRPDESMDVPNRQYKNY